ncbi:GNAT family N-acetyltransferase [Actinotalea subterranea]|uniref:GNAT family N-acetyltransferase n=1 Tax=Actinotalea subterranea TaxID=2607497 RepID=UPI0011EE4051|nr:GNAT family N-acetyltransferase [Actinotalea subterranea]
MTGAPPAPGVRVEVATWPAVTVHDVDGWRVGLSGGFTRRANSVVPLGEPADVPGAIGRVEALYATHGQPAVFRVCAAARPHDLAERLAARGYRPVAVTQVLVADVPVDAAGTPAPAGLGVPAGTTLDVRPEPDQAWLDAWLGVKATRAVDVTAARAVLTGTHADYLRLTGERRTGRDAQVLGAVRAAYAEDWVGLSSLVVVPEARRRGLARALTAAALTVAGRRGARRAFLQVERTNEPARRLYRSLGFREADEYAYHER